ncbi:MAG: hypothetical protein MZV64_01670 [Ignavibacteriales bacterium]|nr:hypothetical protein [Ignavibacteriales bacterium]
MWLWDVLSLNAVLLLLAFSLTGQTPCRAMNISLYFLAFNMFWMASVFITALYLSKNWLDIGNFAKETLKSYFLTILALLFFVFIFKKEYSRLFITLSFIGFGVALVLNRFIFYVALEVLRTNFQIRKNVIVLGNNNISRRLINYFQKESKLVNVLGLFDDESQGKEFQGIKVKGGLKDSLLFAKENDVTEIYSTIAPETHPYLYDLAKDAENHFIHFKVVPDYQIFVNRNIFVDFVDDMPVLSLRNEPLEDTGNKIKKRIFDIVFSAFVIIFILSLAPAHYRDPDQTIIQRTRFLCTAPGQVKTTSHSTVSSSGAFG